MKELLDKILRRDGKFVYWHTFELTEKEVDVSLDRGIVVEADISFDYEREYPYIGHPRPFYEEHKKPQPQNISFDDLISLARKNSKLHIVFDCKDVRVLPILKNFVSEIGNERIMFSAFIEEWSKPYSDNMVIERHWKYEDIPIRAVQDFQEETNTTWIGIVRGMSKKRVVRNKFIEKAICSAGDTFTALAIYITDISMIWSLNELTEIVESGYLPVLKEELLFLRKPRFHYISITDNPKMANRVVE